MKTPPSSQPGVVAISAAHNATGRKNSIPANIKKNTSEKPDVANVGNS